MIILACNPIGNTNNNGVNQCYNANNNNPQEVRNIQGNGNNDRFQPRPNININPPQPQTFSIWRALYNLGKGFINPFITLIQNPLLSIGCIGLFAIGMAICPILLPAMILFGLGAGIYSLANGINNATTAYREGRFRDAENAFTTIGDGISGTVFSFTGARTGAIVALRARATSIAIRQGQTQISAINIGIKAGAQANSMSNSRALLECLKLFTTPSGIRASLGSLKPSSIVLNAKLGVTKVKDFISAIKKRIKILKMSDEQILKIASKYLTKIAGKGGKPNIAVTKDLPLGMGAAYHAGSNTIHVNPTAVRLFGLKNMRLFIAHELGHAKRAMFIRKYLSDSEIIGVVTKAVKKNKITDKRLLSYLGNLNERVKRILTNSIIKGNKANTTANIDKKKLAIKYLTETVKTIEANMGHWTSKSSASIFQQLIKMAFLRTKLQMKRAGFPGLNPNDSL